MELNEWSSGIGKHIVRIEDGKSVVGVFRGEPVRFWQHWKGGRGIICPGRDTCTICKSEDEDDRKATGRFRINFVTKSPLDGTLVAMIFEGGKKVWDQMRQINEDCPLEHVWIRIARSGMKQNTHYSLQVLPGDAGMIKPPAEKAIRAVVLHDLKLERPEEEAEEVAPEADTPEPVSASSDVPF